MSRSIIILLLLILASILIFGMIDRNVGAQSEEDVHSQILQNQQLILEKLDAIDKKLDVIKMRIR